MVISRSHILALIVFTVFFGITVSLLDEQGKPVASMLVTRVLYGKDWYKKKGTDEQTQAES